MSNICNIFFCFAAFSFVLGEGRWGKRSHAPMHANDFVKTALEQDGPYDRHVRLQHDLAALLDYPLMIQDQIVESCKINIEINENEALLFLTSILLYQRNQRRHQILFARCDPQSHICDRSRKLLSGQTCRIMILTNRSYLAGLRQKVICCMGCVRHSTQKNK